MYEYQGTVVNVVDGDTLDLNIDLGLETHRIIRVRLNGIDCPELKTDEGKAAKAFTERWLAPLGAALPIFIVRTYKDKTEKYGRYLADVEHPPTGSLLNDDLVTNGHAVPYFGGKRGTV